MVSKFNLSRVAGTNSFLEYEYIPTSSVRRPPNIYNSLLFNGLNVMEWPIKLMPATPHPGGNSDVLSTFMWLQHIVAKFKIDIEFCPNVSCADSCDTEAIE
mmetsp:Transcript_26284/g.38968  ORF Transcript_26284/g.38968 Transcript_26284/m.38968 type:complete len:101 (-) Transcript_26284:926-1228(-)